MQNQRISVIMSTYNETKEELDNSISSILSQNYRNIEFIIINDNPDNVALATYLNAIKDERVRIYCNEINMGLVKSLNKALEYVTGEIVVRMDADDICMPNRLCHQLEYMNENGLDIIGCNIELIDETGKSVQECLRFPMEEKKIRLCMPWGSCLAHPTWMVKTKVYKDLNGYRNAPHCEDYEFLTRVLAKKIYKIGNLPEVGLKYRVRASSISNSNAIEQYLVRSYISKNRKHILDVSQREILEYRDSQEFIKNKREYEKYISLKEGLKKGKKIGFIKAIWNKYFYLDIVEKIVLRWREKG